MRGRRKSPNPTEDTESTEAGKGSFAFASENRHLSRQTRREKGGAPRYSIPIPIAGLLYLYVQVPWTWQCFVAVGYGVGLEVRVAELPQEERHFVGELQVVLGAG